MFRKHIWIGGSVGATIPRKEDEMISIEKNGKVMLRLKDGEELMQGLKGLLIDSGAILCGVGMLRELELGYWNGSEYEIERIAEPVELLSLQGNLARHDSEVVVHCHVAVAKRGGAALGGHVLRATVHNTAEIVVDLLNGIVLTRKLEDNGLAGLYPQVS